MGNRREEGTVRKSCKFEGKAEVVFSKSVGSEWTRDSSSLVVGQ